MRQLLLICLLSGSVFAQSGSLGIFTNSGDVGGPAIKGSAEFSNGQYRITGSGANMFAKRDQFHYVWREMTGNFTVMATMRFLGQGADHRKAGIMVRQTLDTDSAYADVVIRGTGMSGLQWRSKQAEDTNVFDIPVRRPGHVPDQAGPDRCQDLYVCRPEWRRAEGNRAHRGFVPEPGNGGAGSLLP